MGEESESWQFKGIKKHTVVPFQLLRKNRKETLEETLAELSSEESLTPNYSLFPRTTHLYRSDLATLEKIVSAIETSEKFTSSNILHSASDLGLTHKIQTAHQDEATMLFDGLHIRATRAVFTNGFKLDSLLEKTGVPKNEWEVINDFISCIQKVFPSEDIYGKLFYSYYTIEDANWEKLALRRQGDAQLRLVLNDPKYFTVTALIFTKWGKDFHVYVGEEDRIHQMIAHDFFIDQEIESFLEFYDTKLKEIVTHQRKLKADFGGLLSPIWRLDRKWKMWNSMKETMRSIYIIKDLTDKGRLLTEAIRSLIEKKWAFFNGPRQIWLVGEEQDKEEKIQHAITHFFETQVDGSQLSKISDSPINPFYQHTFERLGKKVKFISDEIGEVYKRGRDLLTAFQTEFSMYAVWLAVIALIIAAMGIAIS